MMTEEEKVLLQALMSNADWINNIIVSGLSLSAIMVVLKILGQGDELEIRNIKIPTKYFWIVILIMTLSHLYCTSLFVGTGHEIFQSPNTRLSHDAYYQLSKNGPLFFRGLVPRLQIANGLIQMSSSDPTTILSHLAAIVLFASVVRFRRVELATRIFSIVAALIFTVANWIIGSNWAVAASELSLVDKNKSFYYNSLSRLKNEDLR